MWPYKQLPLDNVYNTTTSPGSIPEYSQGVWALNAPTDVYATMVALDMNLFVADVNGTSDTINSTGDAECDWYAWAGLDDVIAAHDSTMYTGIFLGPGDIPNIAERWACSYKPWVERARREAQSHPSIVKVVEMDELWRLMDSPATAAYQAWERLDPDPNAHWVPANVQALHDMVYNGIYDGPDIDARNEVSPTCSTTPETLPGNDLELWARMLDVAVPLYIVPSTILGVPSDPDLIEAKRLEVLTSQEIIDLGLWDNPDYDFDSGDSLSTSWTVTAPNSAILASHSMWQARLEFFYVVAEKVGNAQLEIDVNGSAITDADVDFSSNPSLRAVWRVESCIGGTTCSASSAWNYTTNAVNDIDFTLESYGDTTHNLDRLVYLWKVRVRYHDTFTHSDFWVSGPLDPTAAVYDAYGAVASSTSAAFYQDNSDYLITNYIDGLTIATNDYLNHESGTWNRFMHNTCDYLHSFDVPKRCLLDERASWSDYTNYNAADATDNIVDTSVMADRLPSGDTFGDGIISTWLPMPIDFAGVDGGRFGVKEPLDNSGTSAPWQIMLYEPRQSRAIPGETHEYTTTISSGCGGDYTVDWNIVADGVNPTYHWYVQYKDVSETTPWWDPWQEGEATASDTGSITIPNVDGGDQFKISWVDIGGGGGPYDATYATFRLSPFTIACGSTWTHDTSMADWVPVWDDGVTNYVPITLDPTPTEVYDCLSSYFTTGSCP